MDSGTSPGEPVGVGRSGAGQRIRRPPRLLLLLPFLCLLATACGRGGGGAGSAGRPGEEIVRERRAWPVMGTLFEVSAAAPAEATVRGAIQGARAAVFRVDSLMSTYRPASEISALNAGAGTGRWISLSPWTLQVLEASLRWARLSGGAFDPTVEPLMEAWGFHGGEPHHPTPAALAAAEARVGWQSVQVDTAKGRARLTRPGTELDFGAIAKGFALDRALDALRAAGAVSGMANLGGNAAVFGDSPDGDPNWVVGIRHPRRKGELMGTLTITRGSVATSGDYEQMFQEGRIRYSHIMDARTGQPARGVIAVTVAAPDGLTADALSTVLFILGPRKGRALLDSAFPEGGVTALWVRDPGEGPVTGRDVVVDEDPAAGRAFLDLPEG